MSALSRAALVGYSVRCLRSWDFRRMICWAEALRPACPIARGREKRATENASTFRAPRTRPKPGVGRPSNRKEEEGRLKGRRPTPPWYRSLRSHPLDAPAMRIPRAPSEGYAHRAKRIDPLTAPAMRIEQGPSGGYAHRAKRIENGSYAHRTRLSAPAKIDEILETLWKPPPGRTPPGGNLYRQR